MDFFTAIGLLVVLYLFVYLVILSFADCDVGLLWAEKFGKNIDTLKGKVVWITGASSGIGEYLAYVLAKHGAKLIISARNETNLNKVKQKCVENGCSTENILVLPMDVSKISEHKIYFDKCIHHFGRLDILVNNAGRSQRATWEDIEIDVDREIFELNVFSAISLSRLAVKYFNKQDSGHIVVTSSVAGLFGVPFSASYTGSKHALQGYFESLRYEKNLELNVTLLCPGPVFSNILFESHTAKAGEKFQEAHSPVDKRMSTDRCANLCAIAIANKLDEAWMGLFPIIPLTYILRYFPSSARILMKLLGLKKLQKLRDNKETVGIDKSQ
uniref:Dehydrogenase/reductase SDR family member 7 n=1 Tax=Clastoptera arizonana TaxID=38151 RepID=A0A1B6CN73_9HEMI